MGSITINTTTIKNNIDELENHSTYYISKKYRFLDSSFNASSNLSSYLAKIQSIYEDISQNISNVSEYLDDYINDVEGLENQMKGGVGTVSVEIVDSIIDKHKNSIQNYYIDYSNIFEINSYKNNVERNYDDVNPFLGKIAERQVCKLAFLEGIVNVGEMLLDGGAMITASACSLFGNHAAAYSIGNFVEKDLSKDLYYWTLNTTGLDKYADPDSTAANVCSVAGNICGSVLLSVGTGGLAGAAFGAGTAAATAATMAGSATITALTNMGSEGETALQRGATITEAEQVATVAGGVGLVQGAISGKFDAAARAAGANFGKAGLGQICGWALASFGIGASEPLVNEMAQTAIYRSDEQKGFLENVLSNASEDGLLFQMLLSGGANSLGTIGNGIGGISTYKGTLSIDAAIKSKILSDSIDSKINLNDTAQLIPIKTLLALLKDENQFDNFLSTNGEERTLLANAVQNLIEVANKNSIDLGLDSKAISRANYIIENLTYDYMSDLVRKMKSNWTVQKIAFQESDIFYHPERIFDKEFLEIYATIKDPDFYDYIVKTNDRYLASFYMNSDFYVDEACKSIISKKIDVGPENFDNLIQKILGRSVTLDDLTYIDRFREYIPNSSNATILNKMLDTTSWAYGGMLDKFITEYGDHIDIVSMRQKLHDSIVFETLDTYLKNGGDELSDGYNNSRLSHIKLNSEILEDLDRLKHIISHESTHQISWQVDREVINEKTLKTLEQLGPDIDLSKIVQKKSGGVLLGLFDESGQHIENAFCGINECITEFLTERITMKPSSSGYSKALSKFHVLVDLGVLDSDTIKTAYFNNDITILSDGIIKSTGLNNIFCKELFTAFDKAISCDRVTAKKGLSTLTKLIQEIQWKLSN